jgi:predicted HAD superfamily Cof-like phosphohydrolase
MIQAFKDVLTFELASGRPEPPAAPGRVDASSMQLAMNLINEEWDETHDAMRSILLSLASLDVADDNDLAEAADGLADLVWVCLAAAVRMGVDLPAVWERVKAANMAKFGEGAWKDEDGKVRKPPGWKPPDVRGVLASQRPIMETYREI